MGTPWRGLLAPINVPTGDGRRMKVGAITWRELPLGLKWQRVDSDGHDDSVIIGSASVMNIGSVAQAIANDWISADAVGASMSPDTLGVWGAGELFDDVDAEEMPRLAEDVAEALLLLSKRVVGPSVDAGEATGVLVRIGSDTPLTGDEIDQLYMEAMDTGQDPPIEVLFTAYQVAAATLVVIPAFEEARPFELMPETAPTGAPVSSSQSFATRLAALTAAAPPTYPADVFAGPEPGREYQVITAEQRPGEGFIRIAGYVAPFGTCHVEYRECHTAPATASDYAPYHRYPMQLDDGTLIGVGRLTTGLGKVGTSCKCCPGKHDHACNNFGLSKTIAHYDRLTTIAHVRATDTDLGIWVAGVAAPNLAPAALAALKGGRFSGDWREVGANLEMVEVLALTGRTREGFPPPTVSMRSGRRVALTAAAGWGGPASAQPAGIDYARIGREVADQLTALGLLPLKLELEPVTAAAATEPDPAASEADPVDDTPVHTGAMVALVPSADDAGRLALDGGEPADELHATQFYLGEAADWSEADRASLTEAMRVCAAQLQPFAAGPFAVSMFNPSDAESSCAVLGLDGPGIAGAHDAITTAAAPFAQLMPDQHVPHVQHMTMAYTPDTAAVAGLVDRTTTPIQFDTLRVAFGGQNTDFPLGVGASDPAAEETVASLAAAVDEAIESVAAHARAREAAALLGELQLTGVGANG